MKRRKNAAISGGIFLSQIVKEASQSLRRSRRKEIRFFLPAACTWAKYPDLRPLGASRERCAAWRRGAEVFPKAVSPLLGKGQIENAAISGGIFLSQRFLLVSVFALLVGDAAAGLASGLAGSLAFAAAAVFGAVAQTAGLKRLDSFHDKNSISACLNTRREEADRPINV